VTSPVRTPALALLLFVFAAVAGLFASSSVAFSVIPPPSAPDFTTVFGPVQLDSQNILPNEQPVIAFVNGRSCGTDTTQVAADVPSNEPDIGKTVYAVDVLADGTGFSQLPECGADGDTITFYFPALHRVANETSTFTGVGFKREELTLDSELIFRFPVPLVTADGIN